MPYLNYLNILYLSSLQTKDSDIGKGETVVYVSDETTFKPRNVRSLGESPRAISLKWEPPVNLSKEVDYYQIRYKENEIKKQWITEDAESNEYTIKQLKVDTEYQIQVRAISEDDEGPYSDIIMVTTNLSLAHELRRNTPNLHVSDRLTSSNPQVFKLPVTKDQRQRDEAVKSRKCYFGIL